MKKSLMKSCLKITCLMKRRNLRRKCSMMLRILRKMFKILKEMFKTLKETLTVCRPAREKWFGPDGPS